jgi:hypothetical protein
VNDHIDRFISSIRIWPAFVAAAASDPQWSNHLDNIERGLNGIDQKADDDPRLIEILDEMLAVVARDDLSLKERLLMVGKLFVQVRDFKGTHH